MSCPSGTVRLVFDGTNPEAERWAAQRAASLVTDIAEESRGAIRDIVEQAFQEGLAPRDAARLIREVVGLTERDSQAVMRRQLGLLADGATPAEASRAAEAYAGTLHRARALTIARTETMAASNEGQQQLWDQGVAAGLLDPTMEKVWLVADPCDECADMEDEQVPLADEFSCGQNPPLHPNCRCAIGLVDAEPVHKAMRRKAVDLALDALGGDTSRRRIERDAHGRVAAVVELCDTGARRRVVERDAAGRICGVVEG